jgi:hypothetical protein
VVRWDGMGGGRGEVEEKVEEKGEGGYVVGQAMRLRYGVVV